MGAAPILIIEKDGERIKSQPLEGEALLGRSEGCVIRIDDRAISRQHAVLKPVPGGVKIEKKSEFAPLSVNGAECTSAVVKAGDVIEIGPYQLKLASGSEAPASVPVSETGSAPDPILASAEQAPAAGAADSPSGSASVPGLEMESQESEAAPAEAPGFSLDAKAPEGSAPIDLGEIQIDEEAKTKLVPAAKVSAKLVLPSGAANVPELEIDKDEVSIGRGKECDVVLDDKKASRRHAIVRRAGVSFSIKDLDSANGTYVNGSKVQEQELSGDDIIRVGNVEFRFLVLSSDYVKNQENFMPVPHEAGIDFGDPEPGQAGPETPQAIPELDQGFGQAGAGMQAPGAEATGGISGLAGLGGVSTKKKTLLQKYRELPPKRRMIWTVIIIAALYFAFFDDDAPRVQHPKAKPVIAGQKAPATFDSLTPDQKKFVESQHQLAFDYYKNRDYDKAIFEIDKIFALIPDYKDSREIERYAKEGKRKLEALEEEKHKQEEEAKLKLKIAELVDDAKTLMDQKKYDQTGDLFSQILALDPDNQQVADWRKQVDAYEEQKRIAEEQKEVQDEINARAWDLYKQGMSLKERKDYADAIASFRKVADIGATDKRAERSAAVRIREIQKLVADLRDPVLADAKQAEDSQDYARAYKLYEKATEIDPSYPAGYAGMDRIRGVLHQEAKALYIEAVLAESYTDFDTAKEKYKEVLKVAPKDDAYHDRAQRKLASFFNPNDGSVTGGDGSGSGDASAPADGSGSGDGSGAGAAPSGDSGGGP